MNAAKPPRIAFFLATSGHSGVDRLMRNLIPAVARRGYAVDQLKVRRHGPDVAPVPGVRVVDLGTRHVYSSLWSLTRYLHRERPAVLLSDKDKVNRTAILARSLAGVDTRLVLRSGTTISEDLAHRGLWQRWSQRLSMQWLYRRASAVLVPSAAARCDLITFAHLPEQLVRAVPSPIIPSQLLEQRPPPPAHPFFASGVPVVVSVGELSPRKDFSTLLRAFARLRQKRSCRLVILGRGAMAAALLAQATELGIGADVDFPGFLPDVFSYVSHAAVFAFTSRWEGFGNVVAEALACGTPVVSTDCPGGIRDLLQQGEIGALVPIGDDAAMADALERTLDDAPSAGALRAAARPYEIEAATTAYLAALGLPERA